MSARSPPSTLSSADTRLATHQVPSSSPTTTSASKSLQLSQTQPLNIPTYPCNTDLPFHPHPPCTRPNGYIFNANHDPRSSKITSNETPQPLLQQGMLYPVASSGRGFVHWPPTQLTDPAYYHRAEFGAPYSIMDPGVPQLHQFAYRGQQYSQSINLARQPPQPPASKVHPIASIDRVVANIKLKAQGIPSTHGCDTNGFRDCIEGDTEEKFVTVRGRKVRLVDGASFYSLCRSWLRNGQDEEVQAKVECDTKALPKPLPLSMVEGQFPPQNDVDNEEAEDEASVDHLSSQDLLRKHIQRARKVRARFREDRNKRIARYKTRLALLLPSQDQPKGDASSGD